MKLYRKFSENPYLFLVTDTTLPSDSTFRLNLMGEVQRVIMTTDEKLQMQNSNLTLIEKQERYQHYHQEKEIDTSTRQMKKYVLENNIR